MSIFKTKSIIDRLNKMIDHAIEEKPIESSFDESKMSALETKLSHYLAMNSASKIQLIEEKLRINELISDISHQTKTPLSNILLYSQLLEEENLSENQRRCITALVEQAEKLNFLIVSLIKTSRLENGVIQVVPKQNDIMIILNSLIREVAPKVEKKKINFICQQTDACATFDLKWTMEALYNILDNAIKYTPMGGTITMTVTAYQMFVKIDIIDTGIGISEEDTPKIFSRFYRSNSVSEEEGVGIGLYLAREIISSQGGYIKVKSILNEGSTFSVYLPTGL